MRFPPWNRTTLAVGLLVGAMGLGSAGASSAQQDAAAALQPGIGPGTHDPVMIKQGDTYYLFMTGTGISVMTSRDLKTWSREPPVFSTAPAWVAAVVPDFRNHIWAPDIFHHDGRYYLYYSVSAFGRNTSAIGVASTASLNRLDPRFEWVDHGMVVRSVPGRDLWNAIDPAVIHDERGRPWLSFGSFWGGLKLVRLAPDMTRVAQPQEWRTIAARHRYWKLEDGYAGDPTNGAIEAPFIFRKGDYYYQFVSWDRCCRGATSTYKVVVGRSKTVEGPYVDREGERMTHGGGSLVIQGFGEGSRWAAGGHNSAYTFDGRDYLVFHAYDRQDQGKPKLMVREIQWDPEGWPTVSVRD